MTTATTLGAFALGLGLVFAGAASVGNAVGPIGAVGEATHDTADDDHDSSERQMP